ncbi:EamA family transporter [Algibacter pectinivorans]|uniref:Permease of the drug/metabolite transporter (DMT) superfamily n=1 Tax=Algibacter pectinivorans TaxID=870482 RepID=A0A1I1S0K5_9FLAO|nr:EamA family transporter [Algibacter pectinivorans]SFD40061.1 Permease of the drug/metabolite transporter (DMT) superfamily [Algibacter pectinivorans]
MSASRKTVLIILAFFAIYVIWGSTYMLNKIAVSQLPPFFLAAVRFLVASIIIFIIAKSLSISLSITKKQFINTCIAGALFLTLGNGLAVVALKYIDSGFAALEISSQPLVVLIMMRIFLGKKIKTMSYIGVVLGFIGIFLLVSQNQIINKEGQILGMILIFLCMLCWAYASIFVGNADLPKNHFVNTGYQMLTGGIMLCIVSLCLNEPWSLPNVWQTDVQWAMGGLIIFGSIVAFTAFNYLLKEVSPEKVATSTYVNPIIALILGWWILDEQITLQSIIAAGVLLTGVYFINTKRLFKLRSIGR